MLEVVLMARGVQIQKKSNKLTRAQLTEISRANWRLINELTKKSEEIEQEIAETYQDSRTLGRKLKGSLIGTQEDLRRIVKKAKLPTIYTKKGKVLKSVRSRFGKSRFVEMVKDVVVVRFPTPLDIILNHRGVATSIWNTISKRDDKDYWEMVVRMGKNAMQDFEEEFGREYYDKFNPYDKFGNGSNDADAVMNFLESVEKRLIIGEDYYVKPDEDSIEDISERLRTTYREYKEYDGKTFNTLIREGIRNKIADSDISFQDAFRQVAEEFELAAAWADPRIKKNYVWTQDKLEKLQSVKWFKEQNVGK